MDLTHIDLASAMLEIVKLERRCIEALDMAGMMQRAQRRELLAKRAVELAGEVPVPDNAKRDYRTAHRLAQQNRDILQSAQQTVSSMLNQIMGRHSPTYSAQGRTRKSSPLRRGVAAWTG